MAEAKSELFLASWKIFIDGVEVPHQGFSINYALNGETTASISLEPDPLVLSFRPTSVIHIFFRDRYANADSDPLDSYYLMWEGMLVGLSGAKQTNARFVNLNAVGLFSCLEMFKAFAAGGTDLVVNPVLSGSSLPQTLIDSIAVNQFSSQNPLSLQVMSEFLQDTIPGQDIPYRDSADPSFSDRVVRLLGFLATHNALLRMQIIRYRLLDKICSIPDATLKGLMTGVLASAIANDGDTNISGNESVMGIVRLIMSYGFYNSTIVPAPFTPSKAGHQSIPKEKHPLTFFGEDREIFKIYRTPYRNDMVLTPHMFYAMPPPCNLIFPDHIVDLSFSRNFIAEPTRVLISDPSLGQGSVVQYLAPESLLQNARAAGGTDQNNVTSDELFGILLNLLTAPVEGQTSAYIHKGQDTAGGVRNTNVLKLFSNEELEKGLLTQTGTNAVETAITLAQVFGNTPQNTSAFQSTIEQGSNQDYRDYMTQLANYVYRISKYSGTDLTVRLASHRWIVPGFSTVVFNKDGSYIGKVNALSISVSSDGLESSSVSLSEVRPLSNFDLVTAKTLVANAENLIQATDALRAARRKEVVDAFVEQKNKFVTILKEFETFADQAIDLATNIQAAMKKPYSTANYQSEINQLFNSFSIIQNRLFKITPVISGSDFSSARDAIDRVLKNVVTSTNTEVRQARAKIRSFFSAATSGDYEDLLVIASKIGNRSYSFLALAEEIGKVTSKLSYGVVFNFRNRSSGKDPETYFAQDLFSRGSTAWDRFLPSNEVWDPETNQYIETNRDPQPLDLYAVLADLKTAVLQLQKHVATGVDETSEDILTVLYDTYLANRTDQNELQRFITQVQANATDISSIADRLADILGIPAPPNFYNKNLLNLDQLDLIYQDVLGCQPFYSDKPNTQLLPVEPLQANERIKALAQYIKGIEKLNSVYPFLTDPKINTATQDNWFTIQKQSNWGPSTIRWADGICRRQGTTLRKFLEHNKLRAVEFSQNTSDGLPSYYFEPTEITDGWDDTIFSKIVDLAKFVGDAGKEDPAVEEIKKANTTASYLKTSERQKLIKSYSLRHFTQKGFDGT